MSRATREQRDIARRRLEHQHLVSPALRTAAEVVRALGAVQAQDYPSAKWAIAQRSVGLTDNDVERAYASGEILRTHVLRPTWHFVLPEDVRWMLALTASRIAAAMAYQNRALGLDAIVFRRSNGALERALRDNKSLTRAELTVVLREAGVEASTGQHVGQLLMQAELDAVIISGPRRGNQLTYVLFDERVLASSPRERDEALHDLARRYYATRGPATLQDFAWWSGLTVAEAKRAIEACGSLLSRETHDGREHWYAASSGARSRTRRLAHLLPNYDECFVGLKDRSAFGVRLTEARRNARVDALMGHVIFVDGQIVGAWQRTLGKNPTVALRLFVPLTRAEEKLVERAAARLGEFLGRPVVVSLSPRRRGR